MVATPTRPFRFGIQLQPQCTTWQDFIEAVRAVEELGFDTVWNFDLAGLRLFAERVMPSFK